MPALALDVYRDSDQNIYIDGVVPNEIFRVNYIPDPTRRDRRYKSAWMYKTTSQFTCTVHHLWSTKRFPLTGNVVVFGTAIGDLTIPLIGAGSLSYTSNPTPCNGPNINSSLPWKDLGNGVKAIRATNSCQFQYTYGYDNNPSIGCVSLPVVYIAGLPNPSYRVASAAAEVRMMKSNACGILKLANTQKWQAYPKDRFILKTGYSPDHERYRDYGSFNRDNLPYRDKLAIPRCFDGKRFIYQP
jgi:hypothetical protein